MRLKDLGTALSFIFSLDIPLKAINAQLVAGAANIGALTAEQAGLAAAMAPILAALQAALPWIVGIGAAIGAVAIGIKAYRDAHPTLEMLQKDAEAAKTEFDEMKTKVDETKKRIDELNKLKEESALSSTEQNELDNIISQNEQYERQLELLKKIADYKQKKVTDKASNDAAQKLKVFLDNSNKDEWWGANENGLGGLYNAMDRYTAAKAQLDEAYSNLSSAELEKADEKTLDGLKEELETAEYYFNKQQETLAEFQDFLIGLRGDLTDEESITTVDSLLDDIATVLGIKGSDKTFDNFKKEVKSLSDETVKAFLKGEELTKKQGKELQDWFEETGYSAHDAAVYFERYSEELGLLSDIQIDTSSSIHNLASLRDELAQTTKDLEKYKTTIDGGEKGDAAAEYAKAYKSAMDAFESGKVDSNAMRAAADLFFSRDYLAENNMDLSDVGEALSSGIWKAVFSSDDYATNFLGYLKEHSADLGDAVKITSDAAGNVQFAYKSISSLAEAAGMSEGSVAALLDMLDALGVQAMMSGEDMGELAGKLGLVAGETVSSADGIREIIQSMATDEKMGFWDIQATLKSLESAGLIDTSGIANIGTMIAEATKDLDTLDVKKPEVEVSADASKANGVISALEERIAALTGGEHTVVFNAKVNGGAGGRMGASNTVALAEASGTRNAKGGKTYVNELGPETVIQDGVAKEYNDGKPALIDTKPGDIILPADVTADAKRNGHKVKVFGSAAAGIGHSNIVAVNDDGYSKKKKTIIDVLQDVLNNASKKQKGAGGSGGSGGSSNRKSGDGEKIDWIEIAIDRINRKVQSLAKVAESTYKKLSSRLSASKDEISTITDELDLQQKAYRRYMQEASSVGLDEGIAKLVRDGTVDIRQYDKDTVSLINDYKKWYEKALACSEAVSNLHDELASLYEARFEYAQKDFDNQLGVIEHRIEMYNKALETHETKGYMASAEYYSALADVQKSNISMLQNELKGLNKYFNDAMNSGEIEEYSDAWYSMKSAIFDVEEALADANNQLIEYANSMREIQWSYFDYARDRIAKLTEESDFLIDLMSNSELFDDNGKFNDRGIATVGLHAQNFDTYMAQADAYFKEMQKIEEQIARDPYNTTLIQRRDELLGLQQDAIKSAEAEKQAVKSLVEEGIGKELDALKELIDAYEESLDSAKDLYEYQKKISDKSANIAAIQKQLAAYANDSSEENRARVQKLQENLRKAQEDLQETEYDQYIKDQKELLSGLYDEYEDVLNARLDDIESLFSDMIDLSNEHAAEIYSVLQEISGMVGYSLSSGVDGIWNNTAYDSVGRYGDDLTMVNNYLSKIEAYISAMYEANNERLTGSVKQYATGGLVDYTGLAMVDGTPSRPELMLNANDTANFLALRDALDSTPYLSALAGRPFAAYGTSAVGHGGTTIGEVNTTIQIDHVQDYNDMISQMQKDSKFEKMLRAMTTDIAVGGSTMKKNRFQF